MSSGNTTTDQRRPGMRTGSRVANLALIPGSLEWRSDRQSDVLGRRGGFEAKMPGQTLTVLAESTQLFVSKRSPQAPTCGHWTQQSSGCVATRLLAVCTAHVAIGSFARAGIIELALFGGEPASSAGRTEGDTGTACPPVRTFWRGSDSSMPGCVRQGSIRNQSFELRSPHHTAKPPAREVPVQRRT